MQRAYRAGQMRYARISMKPSPPTPLTPEDVSRIIEMAWEDRTPFEAIENQFGLNESAVIALMRTQMKASSFRMWRKRMAGRVTKHAALRLPEMNDVARQGANHRIPR
jgi:uncharacterized protein (TIGR03643 family)